MFTDRGLLHVQNPTTAVGTISVTTLRDGERTLPPEALKNLSDEDITKINSDENQSFTFLNFNACVIQRKPKFAR